MVKYILELPFKPEKMIKSLNNYVGEKEVKKSKDTYEKGVSFKYVYIDFKKWSHVDSFQEFNRALVNLINMTGSDFIKETLHSIDYDFLDTASFRYGLEQWLFANGQHPQLKDGALSYRAKVDKEGFPRNYISGAMIEMFNIEESSIYPYDVEELNKYSVNWIVNNEEL